MSEHADQFEDRDEEDAEPVDDAGEDQSEAAEAESDLHETST
jgi:hypothetical protein